MCYNIGMKSNCGLKTKYGGTRRRFNRPVLLFAILGCLLLLLVTLGLETTKYVDIPGTKVSRYGSISVDWSNASEGYIAVKHAASERKTKLRITYGSNQDTYDLATDDTWVVFPLQYGSGTYAINVYGNVSGTRYAQEYGTEISVKMTDKLSCYLYPNLKVWYTQDSEVVKKADELCAGLTTDLEKTQAVYKWICKNVKYDYVKALTVETGYLPDPDATLESLTGICYDYSSLLCAMLRSQGVYTQLVTGTLNGTTYHAWNRVYIDGTWKTLDATFAGKYGSSAYKLECTF